MRLTHIQSLFLGMVILAIPATACNSHHHATNSHASTVAANIQARSALRSTTPPPRDIILENVRVFNGYKIQRPSTIHISNGLISKPSNCANTTRIDAGGLVLLPGFIDAHCHPTTVTHLESLARHGVTTGLNMACFSSEQCVSLADIPGVADLRFAGAPASAPGSAHGNITAMIDPTLLLNNAAEVPAWIDRQLSMEPAPNYIKIIAETPGLDQETLTALVVAARKGGKQSVTHASQRSAYEQAIKAKSTHVHHVPLDEPLLPKAAYLKAMSRNGQIATPTLTMMRAVSRAIPHANYTSALLSTRALHHAHIPILAGTDANDMPGVPATVPFGSSMHDELGNLVEAGLSNVQALRAATVESARFFGLCDRGVVEVGRRADLVLLGGDPIVDLKNVRDVRRVWVGGVEVRV